MLELGLGIGIGLGLDCMVRVMVRVWCGVVCGVCLVYMCCVLCFVVVCFVVLCYCCLCRVVCLELCHIVSCRVVLSSSLYQYHSLRKIIDTLCFVCLSSNEEKMKSLWSGHAVIPTLTRMLGVRRSVVHIAPSSPKVH